MIDRASELRAIADGRLMLNVRNGVTVSRSMLAMIADEIDALRAAPTVAPQQCGREPDAYEVRCTDGNYEWRRPYHGELEVIMSTGRDRSGKPFEYRALFADAPAGRGVTSAEIGGLVGRLRALDGAILSTAAGEAAAALEAQAAELAGALGASERFSVAWRDAERRAERAEAALAEARKALVIANAQLDNMEFLSVEGFMDWQKEYRAARRALTGGQADG